MDTTSDSFIFPTKRDMKKWPWVSYTQMSHSGSPKLFYEHLKEKLEDLGYNTLNPLTELKIKPIGIADIYDIEGRIYGIKKWVHEIEEKGSQNLMIIGILLLILGFISFFTADPLGIAMGFFLLLISIIFIILGRDKRSEKIHESHIAILIEGEARKGFRERTITESSGTKRYTETYLIGQILLSFAGKGNSNEGYAVVMYDLKEITNWVNKFSVE